MKNLIATDSFELNTDIKGFNPSDNALRALSELVLNFQKEHVESLNTDFYIHERSFDVNVDATSLIGDIHESISENSDIIYYSNAMEILSEHDASLTHSLELASDLGYDVDNINSELLATLINQELIMESIDYGKIEKLCGDLDILQGEIYEILELFSRDELRIEYSEVRPFDGLSFEILVTQ